MSLTGDYTWVKTHLILVGITAGLVFGGVEGTLSLIDKHDAKIAAQYQILADQEIAQNKTLQSMIQAQQTQLDADRQALEDLNSKLAQALTQRAISETNLPKVNAKLDVTQTADKIAAATNGSATPSGSSIILDLPTAQTILTDIQLVPLLQQDKKDLESQFQQETQVADDLSKQIVLEKQSHDGDVKALKAQIDADTKTISQLKADNRKSKLKWFGIGYVAGLLTRTVLGI